MGATYTRQSSYTDGDVITAAHTNDEFDQLLAAFQASSGHTHDGTANEGGPITKLLGNTLTFGAATSGTDITITFDGETSDGVLKWMEDEDYFEFSDDILVASTEKLQFRDTAIFINSSTDGQLDLIADGAVLVDTAGDITLDAGGGDVVLKDDGTQYASLTNSSGNLIVKSGSTTAVTFSGANTTFAGTVTIGSAEISEAELEILDGANVTTTELNIMDGDTSIGTTSVSDGHGIVMNHGGTMAQTTVQTLAAYLDDEITAMPNLTSVGTLTTLTVDNVIINGSTIGHTSDSDLITVASGVLTVAGEVDATSLDISGDADIDGTLEADAITVDGTALAEVISDTTGAMFSSNTETGITVTYQDADNTIDVEIDAAQTAITSVVNTSLEIGRDADNRIKFGTDNQIIFEVSGGDNVIFKASGEIEATSLDISGDADIDGTLEADAITVGGTALNTVIAGVTVANATLAATTTVADSTANTNFPVIFHDESNGLLDDTGALRYNPSTGTLLVPNLSVAGTTTTVDTVTMEASNAIVFEGATADAHETTLTIVDPTADRTINLPNQSGTIPVLAAVSTTQISSTPEELNLIDGSSAGTIVNSKAVIYGSSGEVNATTLQIAGTSITSSATELNLLDGVSGLVQADFTKLAAVDSTATELNIVDGNTSVGTTAVAGGDGIVTNDGGTMRQTSVDTFDTYLSATTKTLTNKTLTTPIANAGIQLKNGSTSAGFLEFFEDSDNGTNKVTLIGPSSTADITLTLPSTAGTVATTASAADEATALAIALG